MMHVVLFEPEIPPNTGNVIRLCANTGARLHLIKPLGFRLDDKSLKRSGLDYHDLALVTVHADLEACMSALAAARWVAVETAGTRSLRGFSIPRRAMRSCSGRRLAACPAAVRERIGAENSVFHSHAARQPQPQSVERGGGRRLRGVASTRLRALRAPHSVSERTSRPISACSAARTGLPSCMTRYTSRQIGMSTPTRSATLRTAAAAVTPSTT